jgi:5-methylcytosine-specific restriction endonuclease McrA
MRAKCDREGLCRVCARKGVDAAHIIPRSRVKPGIGEDERNCCPLCRTCHAAFDQGRLDLLPFLTREEQSYAVELVGLFEAYRRISNERLPDAA